MISDRELGRYECTRDNHNKFYTVQYNEESGDYTITYGPIDGKPTQIKKSENINEATARRKISEKLGKGYVHIGGPTVIKAKRTFETVKVKGHDIKVGNRKLDLN